MGCNTDAGFNFDRNEIIRANKSQKTQNQAAVKKLGIRPHNFVKIN